MLIRPKKKLEDSAFFRYSALIGMLKRVIGSSFSTIGHRVILSFIFRRPYVVRSNDIILFEETH